jgi:hypothetical protein
MASANTKVTLPEGFPCFKVVPQKDRNECGLAAVATLTGRSLEDIWAAAVKLGLPKIGQFYVSDELLGKLLIQNGLVATAWKPFITFDALPNVCLLWVDALPNDQDESTGRTVIFHHVPALPDKYSSFSYCLDVYWHEPEKQVVTDIKRFSPTYFMDITRKPEPAGSKGK